jgi:hypothetical protein
MSARGRHRRIDLAQIAATLCARIWPQERQPAGRDDRNGRDSDDAHRESYLRVLGVRVPIILSSRADKTLARLGSCTIALLLARHRGGTAP